MKPHTVHLYNFVEEVNEVAKYQEVIIKHCYCNLGDGVGTSSSGKKTNDNAKLYIFKRDAKCLSPTGSSMKYVPFEVWMALEDKSGNWTINPNGKDYFVKEGRTERLVIVSFADNEIGSRRMWHFEVDGK